MIGEALPLAVCPRFEVTVYEVIVEPPLLAGAVKETVAWPLPLVALTPVGASGVVDGVATEDTVE